MKTKLLILFILISTFSFSQEGNKEIKINISSEINDFRIDSLPEGNLSGWIYEYDEINWTSRKFLPDSGKVMIILKLINDKIYQGFKTINYNNQDTILIINLIKINKEEYEKDINNYFIDDFFSNILPREENNNK